MPCLSCCWKRKTEDVKSEVVEVEGNPRNKCALQPGHSLMDWIRLGSSGRDLSGVGSRAGHLAVTHSQLKEHDKMTDIWLALRGKVYNVTEYMSFHPGGPCELMKGAGIDATALFDEVHPWVNYESILQKCLVGRLVSIDPSIDREELFFGPKPQNSVKKETKTTLVLPPPTPDPKKEEEEEPVKEEQPTEIPLPRFDWIQKMDSINLIFYTKSFCNPQIEITPVDKENSLTIYLTYQRTVFTNELKFSKPIAWPCHVKVNYETGKIEVMFRKDEPKIWENYGVLKQKSNNFELKDFKLNYKLVNKVQLNHDVYLLDFQHEKGSKLTVPLGKHVRIFANIDGKDVSRSYTAVPSSTFDKFKAQQYTTDNVCLLMKSYADGMVSKDICSKNVGDVLEISKPIGNFNLQNLENKEIFIMLAAGTGITPMLGLIIFLLERRTRKSQSVQLLFFNKTEEDIVLRNQFDHLQSEDSRFKVEHILSEPNSKWKGLKGRISSKILQEAIKSQLENTVYTKNDIYAMICGPTGFTAAAESLLKSLDIGSDQIHLFMG